MRKSICIGMLAILLTVVSIEISAQSFKLSGGLREMLTEGAVSMRRTTGDTQAISLIMKVTDAQQMAPVCKDYSMEMLADLGHIAVVAVPVDQIEKAASDPRVVRMEKEGGFHYCLDKARETTNVEPANSGKSPLPQAFTGNGILVGILDCGYQYNHPTFIDANGKSRILSTWDYEKTDGEPKAIVLTTSDEILAHEYSYGSRYRKDPSNHGTHVAGIAAGSGRYKGMAPESGILMAEFNVSSTKEGSYQLYSDGLLIGINNMFNYAKTASKPLVINTSLGNNLGFSTETKLLQEAFALLTGPGRIIVAANGNEGDGEECKCYLNSGTNTKGDINIKCNDLTISSDIIWRYASPLSITFDIKKGNDKKTVTINSSELTNEVKVSDQGEYLIKSMRLDDAPDGKQISKVCFVPKNEGGFILDIVAKVTSDQPFEAYTKYLNLMSAPQGFTISTAYTTCVPAAFPNVIAVGNYCNRNFPNDVQDVIGKMNITSSWGPTWDGRNKPDVSAPGSILSAGNWYCPENEEEKTKEVYDIPGKAYKETWVGQIGTSQASPAVAGIIALWLQAKPDLTPDDVLNVIRETSKAIEPIPNNHSGAGIINAYAGLCKILGLPTAIPTLSKNQPENITFRLADNMLYADGADDGTPVTIYNLSGAVLQKTVIQQGHISLHNLQKGVYAVQIGTLGSTLIRL